MTDVKDHGEAAPRTRDEPDFSCDPEAQPPVGPAYAASLAADQARLTQALRDVRHLLPPEGVPKWSRPISLPLPHGGFPGRPENPVSTRHQRVLIIWADWTVFNRNSNFLQLRPPTLKDPKHA